MLHGLPMEARKAVKGSGSVTFLFTDIEGSTRRWEAGGAAMSAVIAAVDDGRGAKRPVPKVTRLGV